MNSLDPAPQRAGWRRTLACTLALSLGSIGFAQVVGNPGKMKGRTDTVKNAIADSAALFAGGNSAQAESRLVSANTSRADTAAWHRESAQRLYNLALQFRAKNQHTTAQQIAAQALAQLQQATAKSRLTLDPREEARGQTTLGMIQDRLLGNPIAALAAYEEAARLNPQSTYALQEAARLTPVVAEINRRMAKN